MKVYALLFFFLLKYEINSLQNETETMTYKRLACSLIQFLNITKASVFWLKVCYVLVCFFIHLSLSGGYCIMLVRFDKTHYRYWASLLLYDC